MVLDQVQPERVDSSIKHSKTLEASRTDQVFALEDHESDDSDEAAESEGGLTEGEDSSDGRNWGSESQSSDPPETLDDSSESDYGLENTSLSSSSSTESDHRHTDETEDELPYGQSPPLTDPDSADGSFYTRSHR